MHAYYITFDNDFLIRTLILVNDMNRIKIYIKLNCFVNKINTWAIAVLRVNLADVMGFVFNNVQTSMRSW